jgi:hypothetical protein
MDGQEQAVHPDDPGFLWGDKGQEWAEMAGELILRVRLL